MGEQVAKVSLERVRVSEQQKPKSESASDKNELGHRNSKRLSESYESYAGKST